MSPFWCFILAVYMFSFGIVVGVQVVERQKGTVVSSEHNPPTDRIFERGFIK